MRGHQKILGRRVSWSLFYFSKEITLAFQILLAWKCAQEGKSWKSQQSSVWNNPMLDSSRDIIADHAFQSQGRIRTTKEFLEPLKTQISRPHSFKFLIQGSGVDAKNLHFKNLPRSFWGASLLKNPNKLSHADLKIVEKIILNAQ